MTTMNDDGPVEPRPTLRARVVSVLRRVGRRVLNRIDPSSARYHAQVDHHGEAIRDITEALQILQAQVPHTAQRVDALDHHLPEILAIWSSANGTIRRLQRQIDELAASTTTAMPMLEAHAESIHELWARIEFVRREVLFEMRHIARSGGTPLGDGDKEDEPRIEAFVADQERVDAVSSEHGTRLNLGCGHIPLDDYLNVDMRELPGVDVVAGVDDLPFDEGTVDEIFSAHVLEHFAEDQLTRDLLPYWFRMLRPGGTFRAVVPDAVSMIDGFTEGDIPFEDLRAVLYGGQEYEGDFHFTMFSAESMTRLLSDAGFVDVVVEDQGRRNDIALELQIAARRP